MQIDDIAAGLTCAEFKEGLFKRRVGQNSRDHNTAQALQRDIPEAAVSTPPLSTDRNDAVTFRPPLADISR